MIEIYGLIWIQSINEMQQIIQKPREKILKTSLSTIGIRCLYGIIIIYLLLHIRPSYQHRAYCSGVENDAHNIAAAIADYFATPEHSDIPIRSSDLELVGIIENQWTIFASKDEIFIQVFDTEGKCPLDYQEDHSEWNSNVYMKKLRPW